MTVLRRNELRERRSIHCPRGRVAFYPFFGSRDVIYFRVLLELTVSHHDTGYRYRITNNMGSNHRRSVMLIGKPL